MGDRRPEVRCPVGRAASSRRGLELTVPDLLEPPPFRPGGGAARRDIPATSNRSAIARPTARERSTHSAMVAVPSGMKGTTSTAPMRGCTPRVRPQIDATHRDRDHAQQSRLKCVRGAGHGEHGAVVRGIGRLVEQRHARAVPHGSSQFGDHLGCRPSLIFGTLSIIRTDCRWPVGSTCRSRPPNSIPIVGNGLSGVAAGDIIRLDFTRSSMSDPLRTETSRTPEPASEAEREAKIEQLLLAGLDHYFVGHYDQAINVWTRALFLDRSHARARAYIERARSAQAERLRESEALLHDGAAAVRRGDTLEARRLLECRDVARARVRRCTLELLSRVERLEQRVPSSFTPVPDAFETPRLALANRCRHSARASPGSCSAVWPGHSVGRRVCGQRRPPEWGPLVERAFSRRRRRNRRAPGAS